MIESLAESYTCPRCSLESQRSLLVQRNYQCGGCGLEVAHLELARNGSVRAVLGWLRMAGETLQDRYQVPTLLGKGGFAAPYLVEDLRLRGKRRAVKEIPLTVYDEAETTLLSRLQHPAIPDIVDRLEDNRM